MEKLRDLGYTYKEIGNKFGVCWATISRAFKENGVRSSHPTLTEERKRLICEAYLKYGIIDRVVDELHTNRKTVVNVLLEYNIHQNTLEEIRKKYTINERYFDEIDTPHKAYFLGLLFADGNCSKNGHVIQISLQERDKYILDIFNKEIESNRELKYRELSKNNPNHQNQYLLAISNKHMWESLNKLGMIPNKSLQLCFPELLPEKYYKDFIRGYFDGDGHIAKKWEHKKVEIVSNINFCEYIQNYLKSTLDIDSKLYFGVDKNKPTRIFTVTRKRSLKIFLEWIYDNADIYFVRKYNIYNNVYALKFANR